MQKEENIRNPFLIDLLSLQQDGRNAISAPTNWTEEPLLNVETECDIIVENIACEALSNGGSNRTGRWHFFIGSPGNGKSAAMGNLCRRLLEQNCVLKDEKGVLLKDLREGDIPYAINVFEGTNKYPSVQIVQDASVVRNPYASNVDPASELLNTLQEAWKRGISLVVCTNRGVMEKAYHDNYRDKQWESAVWFKLLKELTSTAHTLSGSFSKQHSTEGRRTVFERMHVTYSHLDNRSLLLGKDTFEAIVEKATKDTNWTACTNCECKQLCPFNTNRDWLADEKPRELFIQLLRRAEVLSGQVIVFREALGIVSTILAGCPKDYVTNHPCDWVKKAVAEKDFFSLITRRIYMLLFAGNSPHGLEVEDNIRAKQLEALSLVWKSYEDRTPDYLNAVKHVIEERNPSTDLGLNRMLGLQGVFSQLDPIKNGLPSDFYERWDTDLKAIEATENIHFSGIEKACLSCWVDLENQLENLGSYSVSDAHWALRRWSSNFLLHFGALIEGLSVWDEELDDFATLLNLMATVPGKRNIKQKQRIKELDEKLEDLLNDQGSEDGTIQLSKHVALRGKWVREHLTPQTEASDDSGSVSLSIKFGEDEKAVFGASVYIWLRLRLEGHLDARCFPRELLSGAADARIRAAARGKYAFVNNEIELIVETDKDEQICLTRIDGEVGIL